MSLTVDIKRLDPELPIPAYAHAGDAGLDFRSTVDVTLAPLQRALIPTGFAIAIPEGYAGFVQPRSGAALKQGLSIANTPGLIDSHYRGELKVAVINLNPDEPLEIFRGDRIAQLVIQKVESVQFIEVSHLDDTTRGSGGFGSTGRT